MRLGEVGTKAGSCESRIPASRGAINRAPAVTWPLARSVLAVVAFCLVASAVYLMNDLTDREADRLHPLKARRPVVAGQVPPPLAAAAGLAVSSGLGAALLGTGQGGEPEDVVLGDRPLQILGTTWAVIYGAGIYLG